MAGDGTHPNIFARDITALRRVELLHGLDERALQALAEAAGRWLLCRGEIVTGTEGDEYMHVVVSGRIRLYLFFRFPVVN